MSAKNKTYKLISALLIVSVLASTVLFSRPKKTEAFIPDFLNAALKIIGNSFQSVDTASTVTDTTISIRRLAEDVLQQVIRTVVRRAIQQMTIDTVNWINSGYSGSPLFVQSPQSFFGDIAKYEVRTFIDSIGYDLVGHPFGRDFALNTIYAYQSQFQTNAQYTLSRVINDPVLLQGYRNDFYVGGWNGFLINTQYPQNNYIGYQLQATDELARRISGTTRNSAGRVTEALNQGLGFLSPETCLDNGGDNVYNQTIANQFKRPRFNESEYRRNHPYLPPDEADPTFLEYVTTWNTAHDAEKARWAQTNTCQTLAATTPGSVVGAQINNALLSPSRQSELSFLIGDPISAILDAMLNQLINKGVTSLTTRRNPPQVPDDWDYLGNTLGGPVDSTRDLWSTTPDEVVEVKKFKILLKGKTVVINDDGTPREEIGDQTGEIGGVFIPGDIINTLVESRLISNNTTNEPLGLIQIMSSIWPKAHVLDVCIPGPDLKWQERTEKERDRNSNKLLEKSSSDDGKKAAESQEVFNELKFAVDFFIEWVENKVFTELPNSVIFVDAVDEVHKLSQDVDDLTRIRREKTQTLARLRSIEEGLDTFSDTDQPLPRSTEERKLVLLWKQYKATQRSISSDITIEDARNRLNLANEQSAKLDRLITDCTKERVAEGWEEKGGRDSVFISTGETEQKMFCDAPIKGGYDHDFFLHQNDNNGLGGPTTHPDLPYVNADDVFRTRGLFGNIIRLGFGNRGRVAIRLSCNIIYKANKLDYKGNLPGYAPTQAEPSRPSDTEDPVYPDDTSNQCSGSGSYAGDLNSAMNAVITSNVGGIADAPNTTANSGAFVAQVAARLQSGGLNATDQVLNGHNIPSSTKDLIGIWRFGDSTMERFDIVAGAGAGDTPIRNSTQADFVGKIPLNCTSSGGGTNCACSSTGGNNEGNDGGDDGGNDGGNSGSLPNEFGVIQQVANNNPGALANSCQSSGGTWEFMDLVVEALRARDSRWGYNCKRGNCGDISQDVVDYYSGPGSPTNGSTQVHIVDIIAGHCGSNPSPAWIDQTAATAAAGTIGKWIYPR